MQEVLNVPDNIPHELLEKAECFIVFPNLMKAAFVVGAQYGRGAMVCRTSDKFRGPRGAPAMYALEGGSLGFQIGAEATDLILLVMNDRGMESILHAFKAKDIVRGDRVIVPATGRHFVEVLQKSAPHNESQHAASNQK